MFLSFSGIDYDHDEAASDKLDELRPGRAARVRRATAATCSSSPWATRAPTCTACSEPRSRTRTTPSAPRRGARAPGASSRIDRGARDPDRDHPRPAAQRHLRPRSPADVRLPRRRRQPVGTADVEGPGGRDLRLRARAAQRRRAASPGTQLEPLALKGKAAPVEAFALTGLDRSPLAARRAPPAGDRRTGGRAAAPLEARLAAVAGGRGGIVGISAEAGMGKSRLVAEFVRAVRAGATSWSPSASASRSAPTSATAVWREIWRTLLGVDGGGAGRRAGRGARARAARDRPRARRSARRSSTSLLGLSIPDNELTASFDPKLRKTSLENLLADCLRARAAARAARARARGLPLARRRSRATCSRCSRALPPRRRCCSCSPTGPRRRCPQGLALGAAAGARGAPRSRRSDERGDARGRAARSWRELLGDEREIAPDAARARRRPRPGQPVLRRGAPQLRRTPRGSTPPTCRRCGRWSSRRACTAWS